MSAGTSNLLVGDEEVKEVEPNNDELRKLHEINLERKRHYTPFWKSCKLKIDPVHSTIFIVDDTYFKEYTNKEQLKLNKCTLVFKANRCELVLKFKKNNGTFEAQFRLTSKSPNKKDIGQFKLFIATAMHYGSQIAQLSTALSRWNDNDREKLSHAEVIEIFKLKYDFDIFNDRNTMNNYMHLIETIEDQLCKPFQAILNLKKFSKEKPQKWNERCKKGFELEYKWKVLSSKIRNELEDIQQLGNSKSKTYGGKTLEKYEQIQKKLRFLRDEIKIFYDALNQEFLFWKKILLEYENTNDNNRLMAIIAGIGAVSCIILFVIGVAVCPPAAGAVAAGSGATAGAVVGVAVGTEATTTTLSTLAWFMIGASITAASVSAGCIVGFVAAHYDAKNNTYHEIKSVCDLWEKFRKQYLAICKTQVEHIVGKDLRHQILDSVEDNIDSIYEMSNQCIEKIKVMNK